MATMTDKDPKSPATTSAAYDHMLPSWRKVQTVLDGTRAMRAAGKVHLPQHVKEENPIYKTRLQNATLFNVTKLTLMSWVGRPFGDPLKYKDIPEPTQELLKDVDLVNNDVHTYGQRWFADGLAKAFSHTYVDFPRIHTDETRTLQDDINEKPRPYWIHIRPEQLFFADAVVIDSKEVLREIRFWEEVTLREGFAEICIRQIRRVYMVPTDTGDALQGKVEIYRLKKDRGKKEEYALFDSYTFDFPEIPLVTFYADREAFMVGVPPLEDLADLNIAHWQSTSEQRHCLTVTRFPLLALSGGTDEDKTIVIGPNSLLISPGEHSKFYYVEHTGAALGVGQGDLAALERQMSEYGAEFLKKKPGNLTATARLIDSAEATSGLQDATLRFQDSLNYALALTQRWMGQEPKGEILLTTEFGPDELDVTDLQTLVATRKNRDISRIAYLKELQRRKLLADDFDEVADHALLEQETMEMTDALGEPDPEDDTSVNGTENNDGKPAVEKKEAEL